MLLAIVLLPSHPISCRADLLRLLFTIASTLAGSSRRQSSFWPFGPDGKFSSSPELNRTVALISGKSFFKAPKASLNQFDCLPSDLSDPISANITGKPLLKTGFSWKGAYSCAIENHFLELLYDP